MPPKAQRVAEDKSQAVGPSVDEEAVATILSSLEARFQHLFGDLVNNQLKPMLQEQVSSELKGQLAPMFDKLAARASQSEAAAPSRRGSVSGFHQPPRESNPLAELGRKLDRMGVGVSSRSNRGQKHAEDSEDDYDDLDPSCVDAKSDRYAPEMLRNIAKFGTVEAWVRFQTNWSPRNLREAGVLALAADYMLEEGRSKDSLALEVILRRLAALQAVEEFGDWEIADAMAWNSESMSIMPRKALEGFIKKANQRKTLRKNATSGAKSGRANGASNGRSNVANGRSNGVSNNGGRPNNNSGRSSRGASASSARAGGAVAP